MFRCRIVCWHAQVNIIACRWQSAKHVHSSWLADWKGLGRKQLDYARLTKQHGVVGQMLAMLFTCCWPSDFLCGGLEGCRGLTPTCGAGLAASRTQAGKLASAAQSTLQTTRMLTLAHPDPPQGKRNGVESHFKLLSKRQGVVTWCVSRLRMRMLVCCNMVLQPLQSAADQTQCLASTCMHTLAHTAGQAAKQSSRQGQHHTL